MSKRVPKEKDQTARTYFQEIITVHLSPSADSAAEFEDLAKQLVFSCPAPLDDPIFYGSSGLVSPPLAWEGVPDDAKSLVLIIDDPDAPDPKAPKMVWVHWVVYNIPSDTRSLPENAGKARLPQGALPGLNDFKKTAYGGPCPPIGRHRYFHKLYALDVTLDLRGATKSQIERAMQGHVLANAELIGTYQKGDR